MPSFRSIFLAAAVGLAALTSAAPVAQTNQGVQAVGLNNVANNVAQGVTVKGVDVTLVNLSHRQVDKAVAGVVGAATGAVKGVVGRDEPITGLLGIVLSDVDVLVGLDDTPVNVLGRDEDASAPVGSAVAGAAGLLGVVSGVPLSSRDTSLQSLPVILNNVQTQLHTLTTQLNTVVNGQTAVNADVLKPVIANLHAILISATASAKLLVGQPVAVILALNGQVLAAVDVAHILVSVLALVYGILATVLHVAAPAALSIVTPLVAAVGTLVVNLLAVIFVQLNVGIFAAIGPLLTPAIFNAWGAINLTAVVAILKAGKN
ncbi:hypothetical protein H0H92_013462 [Tricholoma furcatifolium]|nr:hypothetical protein H0H92_013462 [Tricholoma furcatifolium]